MMNGMRQPQACIVSGDSDFSSLVIKLKEYGKYVIGVGIRESASDLLVQNCDEYYSYAALAGLTRAPDEPTAPRMDPWELVVEAIGRMARVHQKRGPHGQQFQRRKRQHQRRALGPEEPGHTQ